ncbi:MAG: DUF6288 domain-containing protein [Planctomycetota bacterium]
MSKLAPSPIQLLSLAVACTFASIAEAQVHYFPSGVPWNGQAHRGPDAEVEGWLYNLGITGIRVKLDEEHPTHLVVGHVFDDTPADGEVEVGDRIVSAGGEPFETPHVNGYGMDVFGPTGPIEDFAAALERAYGSKKRALELKLLRGDDEIDVKVDLPRRSRRFAESFPFDCEHAKDVRERLLQHLVETQQGDGSWGNPIHNTFAPLALLGSGERKALNAVEKSARYHARNTSPEDSSSLVNWKYMSAAIVMSEYHLATGKRWVIDELQEVYDFLCSTQYLDLSQVNPKVRESHPHSWPTSPEEQHGGWGHNPGFEGYGPIAMITAQGALAFALMDRCGIDVDEERHRAAYAYLGRGNGRDRLPVVPRRARWRPGGLGGHGPDRRFRDRALDESVRRPRHQRASSRDADGAAPGELPRHARVPTDGHGLRSARCLDRRVDVQGGDAREPLVVPAGRVPRRDVRVPAEPRQHRLRRRRAPPGDDRHGVHPDDPRPRARHDRT